MNIVQKAINLAAVAHAGQVRKGTNIPYITHPFAVGMILQQAKCSDEMIAAGILHDTLEDTDVTKEQLLEMFGDKVTSLVEAASEPDKTLPWKERKLHTIHALQRASIDEIYVITADKLHNLQSIREDLEQSGEAVWNRFKRGRVEQHWYYSSIVKALSAREKECRLIGQLQKEVIILFGSLEWMSKKMIDVLFECAYGIYERQLAKLNEFGLEKFAREISEKADFIYENQNEASFEKLHQLSYHGIEFELNSEGPLILAGFCIAIQEKMDWTNQELVEHMKRNLKKL
ncbi:HD domain-containing protein [Ureibacillus sp. NPDC094379]